MQKPSTGQQLSPALTPTHCGSKFAESSVIGVCEGAAVQRRVRNLQRLVPGRDSSDRWARDVDMDQRLAYS